MMDISAVIYSTYEGWGGGMVRGLETNKTTANKHALYQERAVFGKMKMDPAKRAQTQNAGEVSSLQWFFSQSIELMMYKVWLHCIRPMLLK
jgi:hypothetical protein